MFSFDSASLQSMVMTFSHSHSAVAVGIFIAYTCHSFTLQSLTVVLVQITKTDKTQGKLYNITDRMLQLSLYHGNPGNTFY